MTFRVADVSRSASEPRKFRVGDLVRVSKIGGVEPSEEKACTSTVGRIAHDNTLVGGSYLVDFFHVGNSWWCNPKYMEPA